MFLGFVGGGRRGQESWVALKLTVCCRCCDRRCWGDRCLLRRGALLLCCLAYRSCTLFLLPAALSFGGIHPFFLPLFCKS